VKAVTEDLGYLAFDADNHYYEAVDAFTRHLDPKLGPRIIQWAEINGRKYHVIGGRVSRAVVNATFDPIAKAGALSDYFRGNPEGKNPLEMLREHEPIRAEYRDRDARLATMDEHGLEWVWLFPTLGMIYEELLVHDPEGVGIMFRAFNRWLDEDWGFAYRDRIFAAPYISLADVDVAVEELESAPARWSCARRHPARASVRVRPPTRCSTRSGHARTRPASRSSPTPATAGTRRRATQPTGSRPRSRAAVAPRSSTSTSSAPPTTSSRR